jgi:hypothetical protein
MQVTLLEKMMLIRLQNKNKYKICAGIAEILAKTFSCPALSIYAGTDNNLKLMGVFMDHEAFIKSNPLHHKARMLADPDLLEGFNFPILLPFFSIEKQQEDIKLHSQSFRICTYRFEEWKICIVFGGVDLAKRKKVREEIESVMTYLSSILLPLFFQEGSQDKGETDYLEEVAQRFIQSMMDLRGFVLLILRLLLIYFNAEYAGMDIVYQKKHIVIEIGEKQNKDFIREFENLTVGSTKNIFTSTQTHLIIKIVKYYIDKVIHRYFKPKLESTFYLENMMDLTRIYESLFLSIPGALDIHMDIADYLADKMDLSDKEKDLLHWQIGTLDVGKAVIRASSLAYDKDYEEDYHPILRDIILKNLSQIIEHYEILTSDFSLFRSIIKASRFYFNFIFHCYNNDMTQLHYQLNQTTIPENFKRMIMSKIYSIKDSSCAKFRHCPEPISEICSIPIKPKTCFQKESIFCTHFHQKCQECAYYHIHKENLP